MCREGGCGACVITAKVVDPATGAEVTKSVNSVSIYFNLTPYIFQNHLPHELNKYLNKKYL